MAPFPRTDLELEKAGYVYEGTSRCRACRQEIAWYRTPAGRRIPLEEGTLEPHFAKCPNADDFRRPR